MAYYISTDGSDGNNGTKERPWRTLTHALTVLSPGDVLNLRGGTYHEREITIRLQGTATAPITIRSYPGERAVIDGAVPQLWEAPEDAWELVDPSIRLYRSRRTFATNPETVGAWLVDDDVQLVRYDAAENLQSTHYGPLDGFEPLYMGPGLQLRDDGHLYIRLEYNPNDLTDASGDPIAPIPADPNPNHNNVAVFFSHHVLRLDAASYVTLKDLDLSHAKHVLEASNGSHHITLSGCRLRFGYRGLLIRENVHSWSIVDSEFSNGLPDYVYWTDVKNRDEEVAEAYPEFQSTAMDGSMPGFYIRGNTFRNTFDGIRVEDGTTGARIMGNVFRDILDDAINLSRGSRDVEVAHNMLWHVMGGIANLGSDTDPGPIYIHHNVIDNSAYQRGGRPGNYREDNWPAWRVGSPFPGHDDGDKASWWRLYNNTVVSRQDPGHAWSPAGPDEVTGNPEKYVYNNLFFMFDGRIIYRDELAASGSHYDGNVLFRNAGASLPLMHNFGDGGSYDSLRAFQRQSGTEWEAHGLEIDPGLDLAAISDPAFDRATAWKRYRPRHHQVFTLGASYAGLDWPETQGVAYRGAIPPSSDSTTYIPLVATAGAAVSGLARRRAGARAGRQ